MNAEALIALADRCEKAVVADRVLDADIALALSIAPPGAHHSPEHPGGWLVAPGGAFGVWKSPPFTKSFDAAKTLIPRGMILRRYMATRHVPHGCEVGVDWAHG